MVIKPPNHLKRTKPGKSTRRNGDAALDQPRYYVDDNAGAYSSRPAKDYKLELPKSKQTAVDIDDAIPAAASTSAYSTGSTTTPQAKPAEGIDPAHAIAGLAAAGIGAAAVSASTQKKEQPNVLGSVGSAVDGVIQGVGTAAGMVQMAAMPVMLGGFALQLIGTPVAAVGNALGMQAPAKGLGKANSFFETLNSYTVNQAATAIGPNTAKNGSRFFHKTVDFLEPVTAKVAKLPGMSFLKSETLKKVPQNIGKSSLVHTGLNAAFLTTSVVSLYGVATDVAGQTLALRQLAADIEKKPLEQITTAHVLFGDVAKPIADARKTMLSTAGVHALAETASLGLIIEQAVMNRMGFMMGMLAWQVPDLMRQAAEGLVGTSILPIYKGLRDAQERGEALPPEAIAEFILAASKPLQERSKTGRAFALELAQQYAQEGTKLAGILEENSSGKLMERINKITEAHKKPATPAGEISYVERLKQKKQPPLKTVVRPEIQALGPFTEQLKQKSDLAAMNPASPSIN